MLSGALAQARHKCCRGANKIVLWDSGPGDQKEDPHFLIPRAPCARAGVTSLSREEGATSRLTCLHLRPAIFSPWCLVISQIIFHYRIMQKWAEAEWL